MINGSITEFIDHLYYGQELFFIYKQQKYFIQGWWSDDKRIATLVLMELKEGPFMGYLWECHAYKMSVCAENFLSAPLWGGKSFLEIEADVTWID